MADLELASAPTTAPAVLAVLATHPDAAVRRAVARNPNTPQTVVLRLLEHFPEDALANPLLDLLALAEPDLWAALPEAAQARVASSRACPDAFVRWAERAGARPSVVRLVGNSALAEEVRRRLFGLGLAQLHALELGRAIGRDWAALVRRAGYETPSAVDPTLTEVELTRLATLGPLGCTLAAGHRRCPPALVAAVALGQAGTSTAEAARNPALPEPAMRALVRGGDVRALLGLAENPALPESLLVELASRTEVAGALARRNRLPMQVVDALLAHAANDEIATLLAWQPSLSEAAQGALRAHASARVRAALAHNASASDATQLALAHDAELSVREALARWTARPAAMAVLARDPSERVRQKLADWSDLPAELQAVLAADASPRVRASLSRNAAVQPAILQALRDDPDPWVRARAGQRGA